MPLDPKQRFEPVVQPDAVIAFGIFADYDGNAPDTDNILLVSSEELAEEMVGIIEEKFDSRCLVDGWEHCKSWQFCKTVDVRINVACSVEEALVMLGEPDEEG